MLINKNLFFPALFFLVSTSTIYADGTSNCKDDFNKVLNGKWQNCISQNFFTRGSLQSVTSSSLPQGAQFPLKIPSYLAGNENIANLFQQHSIYQQINTYQCTATVSTYIRAESSGGFSKSITWNLCAENIDNVARANYLPYCIITKSPVDPEHTLNCLQYYNMDATITYGADGNLIPTCGSSFSSPPAFCQKNHHLYYCYSGSNQNNVVEIDGTRSWEAAGSGVACNILLPPS